MLGKKSLAAVVIAAFIAVVPMAAYAETPTPDPTYAPGQHTVPSLDATASSACVGDRPLINFSVALFDPDGEVTTNTATLVISGSGNTTSIPLGTLNSSGQLSGTVAWPGSESGGWPGYEFIGGEWVSTGGNFGWTRGAITAVISVNPDAPVPLAYPAESAACAGPAGTPTTTSTSSDPLAATGSDFDAAPLLFAAGGLIVIGGLTLLIVRRRTARRS